MKNRKNLMDDVLLRESLFDLIIDYEAGELPPERVVELFQYLVDTGLAWQLQGFYGRTAKALIEAGEVTIPEKWSK